MKATYNYISRVTTAYKKLLQSSFLIHVNDTGLKLVTIWTLSVSSLTFAYSNFLFSLYQLKNKPFFLFVEKKKNKPFFAPGNCRGKVCQKKSMRRPITLAWFCLPVNCDKGEEHRRCTIVIKKHVCYGTQEKLKQMSTNMWDSKGRTNGGGIVEAQRN